MDELLRYGRRIALLAIALPLIVFTNYVLHASAFIMVLTTVTMVGVTLALTALALFAAFVGLAGIMGAKQTSALIPLCHPLPLSSIAVRCTVDRATSSVAIRAEVACSGRTGVEMEALTAATVAALTVYDMTKALDKGIEIQDVYLLTKTGGKSGDFKRPK